MAAILAQVALCVQTPLVHTSAAVSEVLLKTEKNVKVFVQVCDLIVPFYTRGRKIVRTYLM